jgi:alanine-glyoxylate transaminase/serine-glyoxylate transaminase/serine-pyruvate transaminase
MKAYEEGKPSYFSTPPVNLIRALGLSVRRLAEIGPLELAGRHRSALRKIKAAAECLGLKFVVEDEHSRAHTMSAFYFPEDINQQDLLDLTTRHGSMLDSGLKGLNEEQKENNHFRMGHMGLSATDTSRRHIETTFEALRQAMVECGRRIPEEPLRKALFAVF